MFQRQLVQEFKLAYNSLRTFLVWCGWTLKCHVLLAVVWSASEILTWWNEILSTHIDRYIAIWLRFCISHSANISFTCIRSGMSYIYLEDLKMNRANRIIKMKRRLKCICNSYSFIVPDVISFHSLHLSSHFFHEQQTLFMLFIDWPIRSKLFKPSPTNSGKSL